MNKTACLLLVIALIPALASALTLDVDIPETAEGGIPYSVSAISTVASWDTTTLYVTKNGEYFAYAEDALMVGIGCDTADEYSGGWGVEYWFQATGDGTSTEATYWVDVLSRPPTGVFESLSSSVRRGDNISMSGWAVDYEVGLVSSVAIYIDGVFVGYAGSTARADIQAASANWLYWRPHDIRYCGWSYIFNTSGLSIGSHSVVVIASDADSVAAEIGSKTFTIVNTAPGSATISAGGVSQLSLGQTLSLSGALHDSDGNLAYHNLYYNPPSGSGWVGLLGGAPSGSTSSSLSVSFTPSGVGTWSFLSNGHDSGGLWGSGATTTVYVVDATAPSIPSGLHVTGNTTGTSFTLNWAASSDNVGVTAYEVAKDGASLGTATATSMPIAGLNQAVTHGMTVRARDAAGNWSGWSSSLPVTTPDVTAPSTPTDLGVSNLGGTSFILTWSASSDNVAVAGYELFQNGSSIGTTTGTSMTVGGLSQVTTYSLTVRARDAAGNWSSQSGALPVTTADVSAPTVPSGLAVNTITGSGFNFTWDAASDNVAVARYEVALNGVPVGTTTTTLWSFSGLTNGIGYSASVRAFDAAGNSSSWSSQHSVTTVDTAAPSAPTSLTRSSITATGFSVSWAASSDNVGVAGYRVYRGGIDGTCLGSTTGTSWAFSGLSPLTSYVIAVTAYDATGNVSSAGSGTITTGADTTAPADVANLATSSVTFCSLVLSWSAASDDVGVVGYNIYRDGSLLGSTASTSYTVSGLSPATLYGFAVKARDDAGNLSSGASILVPTSADTTAPTAPGNLSSSSITSRSFILAWEASYDAVGVVAYDIYLNGSLLATTTALTYTITGQTASSTVVMTVRARDAAGNAASSGVSVTLYPAPVVSIIEPSTGSICSLPASVTVSANATSGSGSSTSIAKVEFYNGSTKIGEATNLPYTITWAPKTVGTASLTACATDTAGASTTSSAVLVQTVPAFPYTTGFETSEGFSGAILNGVYGWSVMSGSASITSNAAQNGSQSILLDSGTVAKVERQFASNSASIAFVDLFAKPFAGTDLISGTLYDFGEARVACVSNSGTGQLLVFCGDGSGGGTWTAVSSSLLLASDGTSAGWHRITVRLDYSTKRWDLYLDGQMIAYDVAFITNAATCFSLFRVVGSAFSRTYVDSFLAAPSNPLFTDENLDGLQDDLSRTGDYDGDGLTDAREVTLGTSPRNSDTDRDGMADGWEVANMLNPTDSMDASLDADGDGLSNELESRTGRNPRNSADGGAVPSGILLKLRLPSGGHIGVNTSDWSVTPQ